MTVTNVMLTALWQQANTLSLFGGFIRKRSTGIKQANDVVFMHASLQRRLAKLHVLFTDTQAVRDGILPHKQSEIALIAVIAWQLQLTIEIRHVLMAACLNIRTAPKASWHMGGLVCIQLSYVVFCVLPFDMKCAL